MTEFKLRGYVPGEGAARERDRLVSEIVTRVVPVGGILFVLVLVAGLLVALSACGGPIELSCHYGRDGGGPPLLARLDACGAELRIGGRMADVWFC